MFIFNAQWSSNDHVRYIYDAWWSRDALLIAFWIPTHDDHVTYFHDAWWPHDASLTMFRLSLPKSQDGSILVSAAQTEIDTKIATQADSLFGSAQTLVSHVVMTTLGYARLCKAVSRLSKEIIAIIIVSMISWELSRKFHKIPPFSYTFY